MPTLIDDDITVEDLRHFAGWGAPIERYHEAERHYLASNPNRQLFSFLDYLNERDRQHWELHKSSMLEAAPHDRSAGGTSHGDSDRRRDIEFYERGQPPNARPYNPYGLPPAGAHDQYGPPAAYSTTSQSNTDARGHGTGQGHQSRHDHESNDRSEGSTNRHSESQSRHDGHRHRTRDGRH